MANLLEDLIRNAERYTQEPQEVDILDLPLEEYLKQAEEETPEEIPDD